MASTAAPASTAATACKLWHVRASRDYIFNSSKKKFKQRKVAQSIKSVRMGQVKVRLGNGAPH
jgi:hypothetical protein